MAGADAVVIGRDPQCGATNPDDPGQLGEWRPPPWTASRSASRQSTEAVVDAWSTDVPARTPESSLDAAAPSSPRGPRIMVRPPIGWSPRSWAGASRPSPHRSPDPISDDCQTTEEQSKTRPTTEEQSKNNRRRRSPRRPAATCGPVASIRGDPPGLERDIAQRSLGDGPGRWLIPVAVLFAIGHWASPPGGFPVLARLSPIERRRVVFGPSFAGIAHQAGGRARSPSARLCR